MYTCCLTIHYFEQILICIIFVLIFRMAFLAMGFEKTQKVTYRQQAYLQVMPFLFIALAIINMFKYKSDIYFQLTNGGKIPLTVQLASWIYLLLTVVGYLLIPTI